MTTVERLSVQIGQVKVGRAGQALNAILGSCIGLGFLCPARGIYGLSHSLLPQSTGPKTSKGSGRHVDHAIETLLTKMEVPQEERRKLKVFIAGGANMTMPIGSAPNRLVGTINADFARQALRAAGLRVHHDDTGGNRGRRVVIDCTTGDYTISTIKRLGET